MGQWLYCTRSAATTRLVSPRSLSFWLRRELRQELCSCSSFGAGFRCTDVFVSYNVWA